MRIIDENWELIFEHHNVMDIINREGYFIITSAEINKYKEARLMTKWDQHIHLPSIFLRNKLSILPTRRGEYVIGNFRTHQKLPLIIPDRPTVLSSPNLETLNKDNLYSEAAALSFAQNSGLFDDFLEDNSYMTVSGRMSSGSFDFDIQSSIDDSMWNIGVTNSQIEIDAGIETNRGFAIVEAKNIRPTDFLVRQLYYPYRLWRDKIRKEVYPIFLSYSDNIYNVHQFAFENPNNYNSLVLIKEKSYTTQDLSFDEKALVKLWKTAMPMHERHEITFPQANSFERVLDMVTILSAGPQSSDEIQLEFMLDMRQVSYYLSACRYLGIVQRETIDGRPMYSLTEDTEYILTRNYKERLEFFIDRILRSMVFYRAFTYRLIENRMMDNSMIEKLLEDEGVQVGPTTIFRRASTVAGWIKWIFSKIEY